MNDMEQFVPMYPKAAVTKDHKIMSLNKNYFLILLMVKDLKFMVRTIPFLKTPDLSKDLFLSFLFASDIVA